VPLGYFYAIPLTSRRLRRATERLRRSRGLWTAPIFSGPLMPLAGDELIDAFLRRLSCDLMIVSGDDQLRQLEAMTSLWPAELKKPRLIATGFWFPGDPPNAAKPKTDACGASTTRDTNAFRRQRAIDSSVATLGLVNKPIGRSFCSQITPGARPDHSPKTRSTIHQMWWTRHRNKCWDF
jgi:hypothetical protein